MSDIFPPRMSIEGQLTAAADRIKELEAQLAESDRALDCMTLAAGELQDLCDKLEKQLDAVRKLPEKWSHSLVSGLDGSYWGAIDMCSDEIKAAIKGDES